MNGKNNLFPDQLIPKTDQSRSQNQTDNYHDFRRFYQLTEIPASDSGNAFLSAVGLVFQTDFSIYNPDHRDQNNQNQKTDDGLKHRFSHSYLVRF